MATFAIIGAGFSGTLLALHLLRRTPTHVRVMLIERQNRFAQGPAYATGNERRTLAVARVANCAGPACDFDRIPHPLVRRLLCDGLVRPDPQRLGLDVTPSGALRDRTGAISRQLFAVGPVTRGAYWEMTAMPDIRRQCELLAAQLATLV
jgi:uncharacterized NAD(P)/FAD-binding protein YdhS